MRLWLALSFLLRRLNGFPCRGRLVWKAMDRLAEAERLRGAVLEARQRVAPLVPDIDPGDLLLILQSLLRPIGTGRRFFLRRRDSGGYVF